MYNKLKSKSVSDNRGPGHRYYSLFLKNRLGFRLWAPENWTWFFLYLWTLFNKRVWNFYDL